MNLMNRPAPGLKTPRAVSAPLRQFARGQRCTMQLPGCDGGGETTVLCHVRRFTAAGMGQKPHDFHAYHGCAYCHANEGTAGDDDILRAMVLTQIRVFEAGLLTVKGVK
ncbi:nuclease domain-containing protein [Oceaniglobus trochenteri]|uniref:nuclease domain-containing protein n=1 Tax=Oceaniglobus trochenteri TaxID=2763260 RepID=UPI001D000617|nr:nuclease domain-containing protein [Oceaniglobus trochenteri]